MNFPNDCTTLKDRLAYAFAAKEALRLEHNEMGKSFRDAELSEWQWNSYTASFALANTDVCSNINSLKASIPQDDIDALQITTIEGEFVFEETDDWKEKLWKSTIVNRKSDPDEPVSFGEFNRQDIPEALMNTVSITAK